MDALELLREFADSPPLVAGDDDGACFHCRAQIEPTIVGTAGLPSKHAETCLWRRTHAFLAAVERGPTGVRFVETVT